jgi:Cu+-exporting ATPase
LAGSLEQRSEHPIAKALVSYAKDHGINFENVENFESLTGTGLKGTVNRNEILVGNQTLMENNSVDIKIFQQKIDELSQGGKTLVFVAINKQLKGLIAIEDEIKNNSTEVVTQLKAMNIRTVLLTGDNHSTTKAIAENVGFDEYQAEVLPVASLPLYPNTK